MGKRIFIKALLFFFAVVFVMVFFENSVDNSAMKKVTVEKEESLLPVKEGQDTKDAEKVLDYTEIVVNAVGDCTLGSDEKYSRYGIFDEELRKQNYDYSYFFRNVKDTFKKGDLTIANLEGPLTTSTKRAEKEYAFKGHPSYVKILKEGGVDAVNLANNHSFDYGKEGFYETVNALKKEGIGYFGYGYRYITEVKGVKIGVLGYTGYDDTEWTKQEIKKDIEKLRPEVNILIVSFHWGEENKYYPNKIQRNLGHFAIDEGADLVIGHHPHVLQGIEKYKARYIAYSLGNFVFGGNRNPKDKDSMIFQQIFFVDKEGKVAETKANIIPVSISSQKDRNDYSPRLLEGEEKERVLKKIEELSQWDKIAIE